jgi:arginine decarboxylase
MKLVEKVWYTLKLTYLPQISNNINKAKGWFRKSMDNETNTKQKYFIATVLKAPILNLL